MNQQVLVHIDQGLGPIGAWAFNHGSLRHFYPESLDVAISARARNLMAQRDMDTPIPEWMDLIAETEPTMLDEYRTFVCQEDLNLPTILAEFRRAWNTSSD